MKFKEILEALEREPEKVTTEDKRSFIEAIGNYSQIGNSVYGSGDLKQMCERIKSMVEMAQRITLAEGDWFDGITVNRHMKNINDNYKVFEKTAKEISQLQERLAAAYEDIGQGLGKYFDVN